MTMAQQVQWGEDMDALTQKITAIQAATLRLLATDSFRIGLFGMDGTGAELDACRALARLDLAEYHMGAYRITVKGRKAIA